MDLDKYKERVLLIQSEAYSLLPNIADTDSNYRKYVEDLISSLSTLVEFFGDHLNIKVLNNYLQKPAKCREKCPLDNLCENVLQKLGDMYDLLDLTIFDFLRPMTTQAARPTISMRTYSTQEITSLDSKLKDAAFLNLLAVYKVLKHLEGHNKTIVILGPNGSGKTSFANYIRKLETHIKVIPASKPIRAEGNVPYLYNSTLDAYNSELYGNVRPKEDLLQKLIVGLCTEHDNIARKFFETRVEEKESTFQKVKNIFDDFFEVKLDNSAFSAKQMKAKKDGQDSFAFNDMSDGERAAFFYIATVIAAPHLSFVVVDEPENHLNPAIYNKIWDRLIAERQDCQFIFISHTMEFINARSNCELVKIKNYIRPNRFEFEFLGGSLDDIPSEYIAEIVGSRKPLLFCEGSKSGYDYKIYEMLFENRYTVIPIGNCRTVESSVVTCNANAKIYSIQTAIGIIDSDLKSIEEIEHLKSKKVYVLKCNEIEMLLLDESVFKKVLMQVYKDENEFERFKKAFFEKMNERKEYIIKRIVKTQIDEKLQGSVIDDKNNKTKEEIRDNLSQIFGVLDVDRMWQECEDRVTQIIAENNYDNALRYCCLEHDEVLVGIGKRFVNDYATIALGVLRDDKSLQAHIRGKYFSEIQS